MELKQYNSLSDLDKLKNYLTMQKKVHIDSIKLNEYIDKLNNPEKYCEEIKIDDLDILIDMINNYSDLISKYVENHNCDDIIYFDELTTVYVNAVATADKCKNILNNYKIDINYLE